MAAPAHAAEGWDHITWHVPPTERLAVTAHPAVPPLQLTVLNQATSDSPEATAGYALDEIASACAVCVCVRWGLVGEGANGV